MALVMLCLVKAQEDIILLRFAMDREAPTLSWMVARMALAMARVAFALSR